ncbi:MAG: response regulator [Candidatus Omnitrophota bacterium]
MIKEKRKPVILIVDDDKLVLKSLKIWLKNEDFKPLTASNGDEALQIIEEHPVEVALVDYQMEKEDGISVAKRLIETDDMLGIIMLTGVPNYETAVQAMKIGIFDYISKGSSNEKILESIHKVIAERDLKCPPEDADGSAFENELRMLLFCNHSLLRERLENYSKQKPCFKLIKSFHSIQAPSVKSISQQIDIALICGECIVKKVKDAYEMLPQLYRLFPEIKPVIINDHFTDAEKVELLTFGIKGFSAPDFSSEKLEEALIQVKNGGVFVSQSVINLSLQKMAHFDTTQVYVEKNEDDSLEEMTEREVEILRTIARGLKNKEIGDKLFISEKTVKTHINRIFRKLGVDSRARAILVAKERKLI